MKYIAASPGPETPSNPNDTSIAANKTPIVRAPPKRSATSPAMTAANGLTNPAYIENFAPATSSICRTCTA